MNSLPIFEQVCDAVRVGDEKLYLFILRRNPELVNQKGMVSFLMGGTP